MTDQLSFELPVRPALGRDDFMVAPSNAIALAMIDGWRDWPLGKLALSGPAGSGKTHLTQVWAAESGASVVSAASLDETMIAELSLGPVAIEDVPEIASDVSKQTVLFHIHNALAAASMPLLVTGTPPPNRWGLSLPDLQSRIDAAGHAELSPPDDALLSALLAKLFADRQLSPAPHVIEYLVRRMERSFVAAQDIVSDLDRASLAQQRPITRALAAELLDASA